MKKRIILSFLIFTGLFLLVGCNKKESFNFKEYYESLNGKKDQSGIKYLDVKIKEKNYMVETTIEEATEIIKEGNGIVFFCNPEVVACRKTVSPLISAVATTSVSKIYYVDINKEDFDSKYLDEDNEIVIEQPGSKIYKKLLKALGDSAPIYEGLDNEYIKRIYYPLVVFVKDGEIISTHTGTVEFNNENKLNEDEETELITLYKDNIHEMLGDLCDEEC